MQTYLCVYIATCQVTERLTGWVDIRKGCLEKQEGWQTDNSMVGLLHDSPLSQHLDSDIRWLAVPSLVTPLSASLIGQNKNHQIFQAERGEEKWRKGSFIEFLLRSRHRARHLIFIISFNSHSSLGLNTRVIANTYWALSMFQALCQVFQMYQLLILTISLWSTHHSPIQRWGNGGSKRFSNLCMTTLMGTLGGAAGILTTSLCLQDSRA